MSSLRIVELCRQKGIKQQDLADHLGILRTSLSTSIKNKTLPFRKLEEIADYIGVDVTELIISPGTSVCPHCNKPVKVNLSKE